MLKNNKNKNKEGKASEVITLQGKRSSRAKARGQERQEGQQREDTPGSKSQLGRGAKKEKAHLSLALGRIPSPGLQKTRSRKKAGNSGMHCRLGGCRCAHSRACSSAPPSGRAGQVAAAPSPRQAFAHAAQVAAAAVAVLRLRVHPGLHGGAGS